MSADLPACSSQRVVQNGKIHNGKQNHKCQDCGRQFIQDPQNKIISDATKHLIDTTFRITDLCQAGMRGHPCKKPGGLSLDGKVLLIGRELSLTKDTFAPDL